MKKEIITHEDPKSPISEIFKTLRTNLQFMENKGKNISLLITSVMPGEGKSWITANLATAFAQSNKKVLIIDSDMRKGRIHSIFGEENTYGFSNYLSDNNSSIMKYVVKTNIENLWIITAGAVPPNPSELLSNEKMLNGLKELRDNDFDVVIFDSPPCMLVTDAVIVSRIVNSTIIVTSHKSTKIENLKQVQKNIENVGGKIAGVIINKVPISFKTYKSKYYYYGDSSKRKIANEKLDEEIANQDNSKEMLENVMITEADNSKTTIVEKEKIVDQNDSKSIEENSNENNKKQNNKLNNAEINQEQLTNVDDENVQKNETKKDEIMNQIDEYLKRYKV